MPQREKIQDQSAPSENIQIVFMRAAVPLLKRNTCCTLFNAFNLFIPVSQTAANVRMQLLCQIYSFLIILLILPAQNELESSLDSRTADRVRIFPCIVLEWREKSCKCFPVISQYSQTLKAFLGQHTVGQCYLPTT